MKYSSLLIASTLLMSSMVTQAAEDRSFSNETIIDCKKAVEESYEFDPELKKAIEALPEVKQKIKIKNACTDAVNPGDFVARARPCSVMAAQLQQSLSGGAFCTEEYLYSNVSGGWGVVTCSDSSGTSTYSYSLTAGGKAYGCNSVWTSN